MLFGAHIVLPDAIWCTCDPVLCPIWGYRPDGSIQPKIRCCNSVANVTAILDAALKYFPEDGICEAVYTRAARENKNPKKTETKRFYCGLAPRLGGWGFFLGGLSC